MIQARSTVFVAVLVLTAGCPSDEERAADRLREAVGLAASSPERSMQLLEEATRLDPSLHEAFGRLAEAQLAVGRYAEARASVTRALALHETADYRERLARAHMGLEEHAPALTAFERAVELDPARVRLRFEIATTLERLGRDEEAIDAYRAAIEAESRPVESRIALGALLVDAGDRAGARATLEQARARVTESDRTRAQRIAELLARVDALDREAEAAARAEAAADTRMAIDRQVAMNSGLLGLLRAMGDDDDTASVFGGAGGLGSAGEIGGLGSGESFGLGGLGLSGTGRGGGTGEGTIGLGDLGTIDHGRGAAPDIDRRPAPSARIGRTTATGALDPEIVRRIVRARFGQVQHCHATFRSAGDGREITIVLRLQVAPGGTVDVATVTGGGDQSLHGCVSQAARRWRFPGATGPTTVDQPYALSPAPAPGR